MRGFAAALVAVAAFATPISMPDAAARATGAARTRPIDLIVIHSTGGPTCDAKTNKPVWIGAGTLADNLRTIEAHPVLGIHYMIDRDGSLRTSVPEAQVAHHAMGYSDRSVAIELINDGDGVDPFPQAQLTALVALLRDITRRHNIKPAGVVRHSDLDRARLACDKTQKRKVDPGAALEFEAVLSRVFANAE